MRNSKSLVGLWVCALAVPIGCLAANLPTDVARGHWAAKSVEEVVQNGVMSVAPGGRFQGETLVTRAQAAIALAKLARTLEAGTWHRTSSVPVSNKAIKTLQQGDWKQRPVSRYTLAVVLARTGDYIANGLPRPAGNEKDLAQSETLTKVAVSVSHTHPAYPSLAYLSEHHMLSANSPLLKPDGAPIRGDQLSRALSDMITGLNDRMTPLGHDSEGNTPDATFHKKNAAGKS